MFIEKLELQGFKTFAKKTTLTFPHPKPGRFPTTVVVGPNGSGKSNVADAVRWVLGEQSLKLLRGKESQDVIFSGSEGKSRSGFAEVTITLNNEDKAMPVEYSQVAITRRLFRDGESEYLLNDLPARLSDIQLLLAQANVGQRSYSVIGQGMVDHILIATPEERKAFFDDATGVKQFQLKRHEAMLKLKRTYENLTEVEMLLREIEPRLRSLKRQVSRLERREEVEKALREAETAYYGTMWWQLNDELTQTRERHEAAQGKILKLNALIAEMEKKAALIERQESGGGDEGFLALQKLYHDKQKERAAARDRLFNAQKDIELHKVRAQSNWAPLPLNKIVEEVTAMAGEHKGLLQKVIEIKELKELEELKVKVNLVLEKSQKLLTRLTRPSSEDVKPDPALQAKLRESEAAAKKIDAELAALEQQIEATAAKARETRTEFMDTQKDLRQKQHEAHLAEAEGSGRAIELARLEERQRNLDREMLEAMKEAAKEVKEKRVAKSGKTEELYPEIQRLRYKLELIGGIDPETVKEYEETSQRFDFLDTQVKDLQGAVAATEKIVDELDEEIQKQSEKSFKEINKEFQKFFKILFGGGTCSLIKMTKEETEAEVEITPDRVSEDTGQAEREHHEEDTMIEAVRKRVKEREDRVVGIDIQATPPGKKLKALNLLSGGERAMTSIALVSAIMAVNPSPFVMLDEVDAALDEANTFRFANILQELAKLTQFVIITHNRATMESSDLLYGVTMGEDGVSNLLSVSLSEIEETATARR